MPAANQTMPRQTLLDAGAFALGLAVVAALAYFFVRAEFLALLASLLGALALTALWIGRACIDGLRASIEILGDPVVSDEPVKAILRLENRNRLFPIYHPVIQCRESGRGQLVRYHYAGLLRPGERAERIVYPTFHRRGLQRLLLEHGLSRFPLGFAETSVPLDESSSDRVVWPRRVAVTEGAQPSPSFGEDGRPNGRRSRSRDAIDTYLIREYQQGDPRRSVNWRLSAKLDKLIVVESDQRPTPRHVIILDTLESLWMPLPNFERMLCLMSGLVYQMSVRHQLNAVILNGKRFALQSGAGYRNFMNALSLCSPQAEAIPFQPRDRQRYLRALPDREQGIFLETVEPAKVHAPT